MSVTVTTADRVGCVVIDRPEVRNAVDVDTLGGISAGFSGLEREGVQAAVLTGSRGAFCAGADLMLVEKAFSADDPASVLGPLVDALHELIGEIHRLPFPVIAAVEGPAVGAGMGLAMAADLRVVAASASFLPGYMAIGASPDGGTSFFLTRALGGARAAAVFLRGRPLAADELLAAGLADEVAADGEALTSAQALGCEVAGMPPLALIRMRALVDRATTQGLDAQLDAERRLVAELWRTADFREGVGAFLDKRRPAFEGR